MYNTENAFKLTPCRPEPCDYDVCGSDDDITDKDLRDLIKDEASKVVNEDALDASKVAKESKEGKECGKGIKKKKEQNEGELEQQEKKRPCRKVIKNPFFTNRLKFSTDLPPRPPVPPPQFFPLADEDSKPKVCPKKKKCKKKKRLSKLVADVEECEGECEEEEECDNGSEQDQTCECLDNCNKRPRRPCKKSKVQGPCRKKASETSIPPQPRRIPALLKDLPLTCPKDIPEVERQIWMSRDNNPPRISCKKQCRKKERIEQLLNQ